MHSVGKWSNRLVQTRVTSWGEVMQVDKEFKYHNTKEDVSWFTHQILVFMINQHNKDL